MRGETEKGTVTSSRAEAHISRSVHPPSASSLSRYGRHRSAQQNVPVDEVQRLARQSHSFNTQICDRYRWRVVRNIVERIPFWSTTTRRNLVTQKINS